MQRMVAVYSLLFAACICFSVWFRYACDTESVICFTIRVLNSSRFRGNGWTNPPYLPSRILRSGTIAIYILQMLIEVNY